MAAAGEDMEFGGDFVFLEGEVVSDAVFGADAIVGGMCEEGWWGVGRNREFGVEGGAFGEVGGVDEDGEVGSGVEFVGVVDGFVGGFSEAVGSCGGEVTSGGEAEDADAFGVDLPIIGVCAEESEGALGILKRGEVSGLTFSGGDAVFEDDAGDSDGVGPLGDFLTFEVHGENGVGSAGADEDGGAGVFGLVGLVDGDGGFGDVGEALDVSAGVGDVFGSDVAFLAGGGAGPEIEGKLAVGREGK